MKNENPITIDLSYLHSVTGGDREFEKQLLTGAVIDIDTKVDNLRIAWQNQDALNVKSNAHSLKSLTAIAGIPQIEYWSKQLDQMLPEDGFNPTRTESVYSIINGWATAKTQLNELLANY